MPTDPHHETSSDQVTTRTSRRAFMLGGAVLAGGAALASCGRETPPPAPRTGAVPDLPSTTTTTNPGSPATDLVLLRTGQSAELVAVETYGGLLTSDFLANTTSKQLLARLQAQHQSHADALNAPIEAAGGTPVTTPNEYMANTIVQPQVEAIADEKTLMITAHDLENTLAQSWVEAAGTFTTGALRQLGMTIGGIDARNVTAVNAQLGYTLVPLPMMPTRAALDPKARLTN